MSDTSGPSSLTPLAFFDPDSSCWRMSQGTFLSDSTPCSPTLPASGSMRSGALYALPMSGPATDGPGCSSLPTPTTTNTTSQRAQTGRPSRGPSRGGPSFGLEDVMARLPTPTVGDSKSARNSTAKRSRIPPTGIHAGDTLTDWVTLLPTPTTEPMTGNGHARNLGKEVALLPTPNTMDGMAPRSAEALARAKMKGGVLLPTPRTFDANGTKHHGDGGPALRQIVDRMLPTPTARDHKGHNQRHDETCLTGALTAPPSSDTPPCSDDPHPTLWTDEGD
jgi:hypothetical protein